MKIIAATIVTWIIASASLAGGVSVSSAAHLPAEATPMGSGGVGEWIVPLLAIAIIALAVSASDDGPVPCSK